MNERDDFARSLAELLRADPRVKQVAVREDDFALEVELENGETSRLFLDNYFHESSDLPPGEREVEVLRRVSAALRPPAATPTWSAASARVLPVLLSRSCSFPIVTLIKRGKALIAH
jgi:hypothetical protein